VILLRVRKHFRTSIVTIDYIISDFSFNRISNKEVYLKYCVNKRIQKLSEDYDKKLDRILNFIILHCDYDNMPMNALSKVILSLSHVTNVLSKGFIALIDD
jgi:hypothetical protein